MLFDMSNCVDLYVIKRWFLEWELKIFFIMLSKAVPLIFLFRREIYLEFHFNTLTIFHHFNVPELLQIRIPNVLSTSEVRPQEQ